MSQQEELKIESIRVLQSRISANDVRIDDLERQLHEAREEMKQLRARVEELKSE